MNKRILIIAILSVFAAVQFSGCSLLKKRTEKKEKSEYKLSGLNKKSLSVENISGEIKVTKTSDTLGTIIISAEKVAEVKHDEIDKPIESVQVNIDTSGSEVKIFTEYRKTHFSLFSKHDNGKVNYEIKVPAGMLVDINNTNGTISFTELSNDIKANSVNGSVNLVRCTGDVKIEGVNGGVYANLDSVKSLSVEIVNGSITIGSLRNVNARVNASTTHGKVKFNGLSFTNLVSERKELSGILGTGTSTIKLETVNGSITLDAAQVELKKNKHGDFNFKIDFDDDDDDYKTEKKEKKDSAKTLDQKTQDTSNSRAK